DNNIYKVKNFAKHQNIKVKEKSEIVKKENEIGILEKTDMDKNKETEVRSKDETNIQGKVDVKENKNDEIPLLKVDNPKLNSENEFDNNSNVTEVKKDEIDQHNNSPVIFEVKKDVGKKRKVNKKKNESIIEVYDEDDSTDNRHRDDAIFWLSDGDITLGEGETIISEWSFE
ncbi:replication protein, partial [Clostridium sp. 2-1]